MNIMSKKSVQYLKMTGESPPMMVVGIIAILVAIFAALIVFYVFLPVGKQAASQGASIIAQNIPFGTG